MTWMTKCRFPDGAQEAIEILSPVYIALESDHDLREDTGTFSLSRTVRKKIRISRAFHHAQVHPSIHLYLSFSLESLSASSNLFPNSLTFLGLTTRPSSPLIASSVCCITCEILGPRSCVCKLVVAN